MTYNDNECSVTISRQRYAELVIAEKDAERLKLIIETYSDLAMDMSITEINILRNLLNPKGAKHEGLQ